MRNKSVGNIKLIIISSIAGVIITAAVVLGGLYFMGIVKLNMFSSSSHHVQPPIYFDIKPAFLVNAQDDEGLDRFMQVTVTVMARDQAAIDAITTNLFAVQNDLREVISGQKYTEMIVGTGIERLRKEAEAAVKKCIKIRHLPVIETLYFTSFVIQ